MGHSLPVDPSSPEFEALRSSSSTSPLVSAVRLTCVKTFMGDYSGVLFCYELEVGALSVPRATVTPVVRNYLSDTGQGVCSSKH